VGRMLVSVICLSLLGCVRTLPQFQPSTLTIPLSPDKPSASFEFFYSTSEDWSAASESSTRKNSRLLLEALRESGMFSTVTYSENAASRSDYELRVRWRSIEHIRWAVTGIFAFLFPLQLGFVDSDAELLVYDSEEHLLGQSEAKLKWEVYASIYHLLALGPSHSIGQQEREGVRLVATELLRRTEDLFAPQQGARPNKALQLTGPRLAAIDRGRV
jgi:hypothetical protein